MQKCWKINVDDTRFAVFGTRLGGRLKSGIVKLERNSKSLKRKKRVFRENQSEWHTFWSIWNPLKGLPEKVKLEKMSKSLEGVGGLGAKIMKYPQKRSKRIF